jgi:hypothetical protein
MIKDGGRTSRKQKLPTQQLSGSSECVAEGNKSVLYLFRERVQITSAEIRIYSGENENK